MRDIAGIAGLPPQAGLYTLVASLLVYALLGTARHLSVQATSATAALLATDVAAAVTAAGAASDPKTYAAYATGFVLVTGVLFLVAGLARLGFITQFLSKPVMDGFVVGHATCARTRAWPRDRPAGGHRRRSCVSDGGCRRLPPRRRMTAPRCGHYLEGA